MSQDFVQMKSEPYEGFRNAGNILYIIAGTHTLFGFILGGRYMLELLQEGWVGALKEESMHATLFWFLVCGWFMATTAMAVKPMHRAGFKPQANLGWQLIAIALVGGLAIPVSGFWTALIPGAMLIRDAARA